jgi:P27 family predicted phage terminase small subunit
MAGRKRKPTEMLKASDTFRPDRHGGKMEMPVTAPIPPTQLDGVSSEAFEFLSAKLVGLGVVSELDRYALQMFADAWEDYVAAREVIRRDGPTYTTTTPAGDTMFRPRPELSMMQNAWDRLKKMLPEYGLTAASRAKIDAKEQVQDIDDLLL